MIVPLEIAEQQTFTSTGERIPKLRLTHDQTISILEDSQSSNDLPICPDAPK
jgi:hypothetical protein